MRDPTRRAVLSVGLLLPAKPFGRPVVPARDDEPAMAHGIAFSGRSGVNVVPLGFNIYQPASIATWDKALPDSRLRGLRMAGFDHIRVAFDPSPALAANTAAAFDETLATARYAIDAALRCGLKVIFDFHVATQGDWNTVAIEADYPSGQKWRHYGTVASRFAQLCADYPAALLAFELYNENSNNESFGNTAWASRVQALWTSIRAVNRKTTLLVGGSFYSSIEGLRDLKGSEFDANTGFSVHNYNPTIFTHQNAASYTRYVQRLHYPPIPSERQAAIDSMTALVAASDLSATDKLRTETDRTHRLSTYFDQPQGPDYIAAKVREIHDWQGRNKVSSARIFITEFGSHNDHDFPGAPLLARFAWTQDVDQAHETAGYCRSVWTYNSPDYWDITEPDGSWRIMDGFLIALGHVPGSDLEPEAKALFSTAATQPSARDGALVSETIRQMKEHGLWDKLDALFVFAGPAGPAGIVPEWKRGGAPPEGMASLSYAQGRGVMNRPNTTAHIDLQTGAQSPAGHVGLFVVGKAPERMMQLGWDASPIIQLDPASGVTSGATTGNPKGDASLLHAVVSGTSGSDTALYVNGSYSGPAAALMHSDAGGLGATWSAPNHAGCAVIHTGGVLSAEEAKNLFTTLRFFVNGAARNAKLAS